MAHDRAAIMDQVLELIAEGKGLPEICKADDMPSRSTIHKWLSEDAALSDRYARAREEQADFYADEIVEIADTEGDSNKARVRIDARKWKASKLAPKRYGDSSVSKIEHGVSPEVAAWLGLSSASP